MVTLEDVCVPEDHLIGQEGAGFMYILQNFNHERWIIAAGANRSSRECYREAFEWAMVRRKGGVGKKHSLNSVERNERHLESR